MKSRNAVEKVKLREPLRKGNGNYRAASAATITAIFVLIAVIIINIVKIMRELLFVKQHEAETLEAGLEGCCLQGKVISAS